MIKQKRTQKRDKKQNTKIMWVKATLKSQLSTIETEFVFCFRKQKNEKPHFYVYSQLTEKL